MARPFQRVPDISLLGTRCNGRAVFLFLKRVGSSYDTGGQNFPNEFQTL